MYDILQDTSGTLPWCNSVWHLVNHVVFLILSTSAPIGVTQKCWKWQVGIYVEVSKKSEKNATSCHIWIGQDLIFLRFMIISYGVMVGIKTDLITSQTRQRYIVTRVKMHWRNCTDSGKCHTNNHLTNILQSYNKKKPLERTSRHKMNF